MEITRYDNREGGSPVWSVVHDDSEVFHFTIVSVGQVLDTVRPYLDTYKPSIEGWEQRYDVVVELMAAAERSGLPIPIPQFLKTNMSKVVDYINEGSKDLLIEFENNNSELWLDMSPKGSEMTPRIMAVELLSSTM